MQKCISVTNVPLLLLFLTYILGGMLLICRIFLKGCVVSLRNWYSGMTEAPCIEAISAFSKQGLISFLWDYLWLLFPLERDSDKWWNSKWIVLLILRQWGSRFPVRECLQPVYSSLVLYIGYKPLLTGSHMRNMLLWHLLLFQYIFYKLCMLFWNSAYASPWICE